MYSFELWDLLRLSPEYFDSLNYSEHFKHSEYSNTLNRVERFESVRLSMELEGVAGLKIEFNALECLER